MFSCHQSGCLRAIDRSWIEEANDGNKENYICFQMVLGKEGTSFYEGKIFGRFHTFSNYFCFPGKVVNIGRLYKCGGYVVVCLLLSKMLYAKR